MKVAIIGLGREGEKAVSSFLNYGWSVYASDLSKDIILDEIPKNQLKNLDLELGNHDFNKIRNADAVAISPSLFNIKIADELKESKKLVPDILNKHKKTYTIAVTGTNGKTTTSSMLYEILKNAGYKVLIGGNAGGGFEGYYDLILDANQNKYDYIIVEVCDMTLDFADYSFDFDLAILTNLGNDHMDYHISMENYKKEVEEFLKNKNSIVSEDYKFPNSKVFKETDIPLKLLGKFNRLNAGAAECAAKEIAIPNNTIQETLANFKPVEGRMTYFSIEPNELYIGKTDNIDAIRAILNETSFNTIFIGTPRLNEDCRWSILKEVLKEDIENLFIFKGLDDTVEIAKGIVEDSNYKGNFKIAYDTTEILDLIKKYKEKGNILIAGNGQKIISDLQSKLRDVYKELQ